MSAKRRSFDLEPKGKSAPAKKKPAKRAKPEPRERRPARRKSLRERRREAGRWQFLLVGVLIAGAAGALVYGLWRPEVRITSVTVPGSEHEAEIASAAAGPLKGKYYSILPRDSFFFYPEREVKEAVLAAYPSVMKVSVSRDGFDSLRLTLTERDISFWWCGVPEDAGAGGESPCYEADEDGYVFAPAPAEGATTTLRVYASLETGTSSASYPLRAHVMGTEKIGGILSFAKSVMALGTPLNKIAIRGDEADLFTVGGTRITYVIGREDEAAANAEVAFPKLNLMDGSVEYVDLRFADKVYLKRSATE